MLSTLPILFLDVLYVYYIFYNACLFLNALDFSRHFYLLYNFEAHIWNMLMRFFYSSFSSRTIFGFLHCSMTPFYMSIFFTLSPIDTLLRQNALLSFYIKLPTVRFLIRLFDSTQPHTKERKRIQNTKSLDSMTFSNFLLTRCNALSIDLI